MIKGRSLLIFCPNSFILLFGIQGCSFLHLTVIHLFFKLQYNPERIVLKIPLESLCAGHVSVRGYREANSSLGQTNQPQPATYNHPHPGGDDLVPQNRRSFPLQAQGTRSGRQEDSGGAPELSDSKFV